jgi:tetratricopeptide (TPR) repeat protein
MGKLLGLLGFLSVCAMASPLLSTTVKAWDNCGHGQHRDGSGTCVSNYGATSGCPDGLYLGWDVRACIPVDRRACEQADDPDVKIRACSGIIQGKSESAKNRATAFNRRGDAYYAKGDYDRAIADHTEAIRLNPSYAPFYNYRGDSYFAKGDYDRAIADYNEAIRLNPRDAAAYAARGNAYRAKNDFARAKADYDEAIRLDPRKAAALRDRIGAPSAKDVKDTQGVKDSKDTNDKKDSDYERALAMPGHDEVGRK